MTTLYIILLIFVVICIATYFKYRLDIAAGEKKQEERSEYEKEYHKKKFLRIKEERERLIENQALTPDKEQIYNVELRKIVGKHTAQIVRQNVGFLAQLQNLMKSGKGFWESYVSLNRGKGMDRGDRGGGM